MKHDSSLLQLHQFFLEVLNILTYLSVWNVGRAIDTDFFKGSQIWIRGETFQRKSSKRGFIFGEKYHHRTKKYGMFSTNQIYRPLVSIRCIGNPHVAKIESCINGKYLGIPF